MNLFSFLGYIKEKPKFKKVLIFFIVLLIPNILRQVIYWFTYNATSSLEFIASFETKTMYAAGFPFFGVLEEIILGIIFVVLWFKFRKLKFLSYAWIIDSFFDFLSVLVFIFVGMTPLQILGLSIGFRFFIREFLVSYLSLGILAYNKKWNIKILSLIVSVFALIVLLFVLF